MTGPNNAIQRGIVKARRKWNHIDPLNRRHGLLCNFFLHVQSTSNNRNGIMLQIPTMTTSSFMHRDQLFELDAAVDCTMVWS